MASFQTGAVVLILFPFTDGVSAKKRPALVLLDSNDADLLLARITTQPCHSAHVCELLDWARAGLRAPSWVRMHKLATLESKLVEKQLGVLTDADWQRVWSTQEQTQRLVQKGRAGRA